MNFVTKRLRWMLIGAGAAWLFDPELGPQRRERLSRRAHELLDTAGIHMAPVPASSPVGAPESDFAWASASSAKPAPPADERPLAASVAR